MHRLLPPPNDDVVDGGVQELCVGGAVVRLICEGCTCV